MHPFSLFFFCGIVAFAAGFMFPVYGFLILGFLTIPFPVIWGWIMYKEHFRTGQLLFWVATLSAVNFSTSSGAYLFFGSPLACLGMGAFVLFMAAYVFRLNRALPRAHVSQVRVHPWQLKPEDDNND